jgi:hypothetical protein
MNKIPHARIHEDHLLSQIAKSELTGRQRAIPYPHPGHVQKFFQPQSRRSSLMSRTQQKEIFRQLLSIANAPRHDGLHIDTVIEIPNIQDRLFPDGP